MDYNLLLHVDTDMAPVLNLAFNNAANYKAALPQERFSMVLVVNGPGVKLLTQENAALAARWRELQTMGLELRVCANALKTFSVSADDLWQGCQVIPAGVVEIVHLQRQGFAYIKP